jgi:hypothetical protein
MIDIKKIRASSIFFILCVAFFFPVTVFADTAQQTQALRMSAAVEKYANQLNNPEADQNTIRKSIDLLQQKAKGGDAYAQAVLAQLYLIITTYPYAETDASFEGIEPLITQFTENRAVFDQTMAQFYSQSASKGMLISLYNLSLLGLAKNIMLSPSTPHTYSYATALTTMDKLAKINYKDAKKFVAFFNNPAAHQPWAVLGGLQKSEEGGGQSGDATVPLPIKIVCTQKDIDLQKKKFSLNKPILQKSGMDDSVIESYDLLLFYTFNKISGYLSSVCPKLYPSKSAQ